MQPKRLCYSDAEALADQFADFFDEKTAKICQEFSESSPEMVEEDPIGQPPQLCEFTPITQDEHKNIIVSGNSKSFMLDPIPTTLLKVSLGTQCEFI